MKKILFLLLIVCSFSTLNAQTYLQLKREILHGKTAKVEKICHKKINSGDLKTKKLLEYYLALGDVQLLDQNYTASEKSFRSADSCLQVMLNANKRVKSYHYDVKDRLAVLYLERGNYIQAESVIREVITWREGRFKKKSPDRLRSYATLAKYFDLTGQFDSAIHYSELYVLGLKNARFNSPENFLELGEMYYLLSQSSEQNGDYEEALHYAKMSKRYNFHSWTKHEAGKNTINKINALNSVAQTYYLNGKTVKARHYSKKALRFYDRKIPVKNITYVPLLFTAAKIAYAEEDFMLSAGYLSEAYAIQVEFLQETLSELSEYERERFYLDNQKRAWEMNAFAFALYQDHKKETYAKQLMEDMFAYTLNTKGILLSSSNQFVNKIEGYDDSDPVKQKFYEWKAAKNKLAQFMVYLDYEKDKEVLNQQQNKVNELEKQIKGLVSDKNTGVFNNPITNDDLARLMSSDEIFLNVIRINSLSTDSITNVSSLNDSLTTYVYLTLEGGSQDVTVYSNQEGLELEGKYHKAYKNHIKLKVQDNVSYENYMGQLDSTLAGKSRMIILNDGIYNLVNLGSLYNPSQDQYVSEYLDLVTITSFSDLKLRSSKALPKKGVVLLGRPLYKSDQDSLGTASATSTRGLRSVKQELYADLPGTEKEVRSIEETLAKAGIQSTVLLGKEASEENLKRVRPQGVLHISTHGYFEQGENYSNPLLGSGLVLAGANDPKSAHEEDGILNAYEASLLNLEGVELVVLSACETGLGQIKGGEGVYGLQRSFKSAGVDYVIMSLWKVDDAATEQLMSTFYKYLVETENVRKAFNKAQLELKEVYPDPYYWSAFVLIGY